MLTDIDLMARTTWAAPNGDQWVFHSEETQDRASVADVFDAHGALIGRVIPLSESRAVGFAAERLYLVRTAPKEQAA